MNICASMEQTQSKFVCEFCKKSFARESSILTHMCEPKRRRLEKSERGVQLGFQAFVLFYQTLKPTAAKTFDDFADSPYYKAFVKFGRYCVSIRAINPARFMEWLLKQNKKIDRWCSDQIYTEYLLYYLLVETVDDALARSIEYSIDWNEKTGHPAQDCLRYGNTNAVCYAITTGRVSPWVIYNSESGQKFLSGLDAGQLGMIWPYIDSDRWQQRFHEHPEDQQYARDILSKAGW
jgi:hypothetical protein